MKPQDRHRTGFTLIEMMTVVAILAILSTLLIVGISKLQTNAKRQQTAQILENCRAMWAEYDSVNRLHIDQFPLSSPANVTLEAEIQTENQGGGNFGDRLGGAVLITRTVFSLMRSQPNIRAEMDKFPSGRMFLTTLATQPNTYYGLSGGPYMTNTAYGAGSFVTYADPDPSMQQVSLGYYCIHTPVQNPDGSYPASPPPSDTGYWVPLLNEPTDPVLLDAWGNPIICCIGGELGGITPQGTPATTLGGNGTVPQGAVVVGGKWVSGSSYVGGKFIPGIVTGPAQVITVKSPDHRLFFASSGPDGDFSKGDDNLYSFEKF